jgi:hypothetical protein
MLHHAEQIIKALLRNRGPHGSMFITQRPVLATADVYSRCFWHLYITPAHLQKAHTQERSYQAVMTWHAFQINTAGEQAK